MRLVIQTMIAARSRRGHTSLLALAALGALALGAAGAGLSAAFREVPGAVTVWGPKQLNGSPAGTNYVERFTVSVIPGNQYLLELVNGSASGSNRADSVIVKLNGHRVENDEDLTPATDTLILGIAVREVDTLRITVHGPAGSYVTARVLTAVTSEYTINGPTNYAITSGTSKTHTYTVTKDASAGPRYRLYALHGDSAGGKRADSVRFRINGTTISGANLKKNQGSVTKIVTLLASNTIQVTLWGAVGSFVTVRFTANDSVAPVLAITAPAANAVTRSPVTVTGTISDATPTRVTVNGVEATVTGNTSYSASVPLATEGSNVLTVIATDAGGRQTTLTRTVIRDTQAPALTVTAPADGSQTSQATATVTGTVQDATAVTVNVNGTPLTVGAGGAFSGSVALSQGANVLTITATDAAGNATSVVRTVTRGSGGPVLTVTSPAAGSSTAGDSVTVSGTVTGAAPLTVTANGATLPVSSGAFSAKVPLVPGANTILVVATDGAANRTVVSRTVFRTGAPPPDPTTVASTIDPTRATTFESSIAFLYTGPNAIQTGVAVGTIKPVRAAVFKGRALDRAGDPLSGVAVTVVNHPEFGATYTRSDGEYDFAVNGGDQHVLSFAKAGFLTVHRTVTSLTQDFVVVDDVALSPADAAVTTINFSTPMEVAQGSVMTDASGSRQATLLFEQGTQATMTLADGTTQPLGSIDVRATELTVGPRGPAQMPGTLPATSGYTYAVDLTVDAAQAAGAKDVQFDKPVALYNDNFLAVPVGAGIPVGYYDQVKGRWVPSRDGRVIKILGTTGGRADVDITGDGVADDSTALAVLGIDNAERDRLATLYPTGKSLWRVEVTHFTTYDSNFGRWFPDGWDAPTGRPLGDSDPTDPCEDGGSIIECETQTLGEQIPIAGTGYFLAYRSDRQPGRVGKGTVRIPLTAATVPTGVKRVELTVEVAGQRRDSSFAATPNQTFLYRWDGRDAYGRLVQGAQRATVGVGYVYDAVYRTPSQLQTETFGQYLVAGVTTIGSREEIIAWQYEDVWLGGLDARTAIGLGGWTLSSHHFYDPGRRLLYLGTGERRAAEGQAGTITTFAGTGVAGFSGDDGRATGAKLDFPVGVGVGPDGSVYISEYNNMRIRKVDPQGIITTVAGTGSGVVSGDGGPATQAGLGRVLRFDVAPDGTITFGTDFEARVRQIAPDGTISTIAGTGTVGFSGDGGPATQATISQFPREVQHGADGSVYFIDGENHRVRRVSPSGTIHTIAGTGAGGFSATDSIAGTARLNFPEALAVGPDGSVYIEDGDNSRVRRITPDGRIEVVLGTGQSGSNGDGGRGTSAQIGFQAQGIDVDANGALYLAEFDWCRIRRLGTDQIVTTVAGAGSCGFSGDGGPATQARLNLPFDVAVAPDGSIYIADGANNRVRRVSPAFPGFSGGDVAVASADGTELYQFSASGRHLRTRDTRTGATLLTFGYDQAGSLASVTDSDGNVTTIERDGQGRPTAIVAPFGQRTPLAVDGAGYLSSVTDPGGNQFQLYHSAAGLLDSLTDARGNVHRFTYDSLGRLRRDEDPAGGSKTIAAVDGDTSVAVSVTTALNRTTTYLLQQLPTGATRRVITDPAGQSMITVRLPSGRDSTNLADGSRVVTQVGADPRWGMQAPVVVSSTIRLPSGLTATMTGGRRSTLATPDDPLSLTSLIDSTIVNGQLFKTVYSQADRRFSTTSPEGRQRFTTVDPAGRVTVARTPGLDSVMYSYDNRGQLSQVQVGGRMTSYTYDSRGRLQSAIDPVGRRDSLFYNDADRLIRRRLTDGREVQFSYDSSGNLTSVTPPGRSPHGFRSTVVDLDSLYIPPDLGTGARATGYRYNQDRQLTAIDRPDGVTLQLGYEAASGRLSTVNFERGQLQYSYSPATGNLAGITAPGGLGLAYTYDGALPQTTTWSGAVVGSVGVTYNSDFRVIAQTVNGATSLSFGYDRDGLLTSAGALGIKRNVQYGQVERDSLGSVLGVWSHDAKGKLAGYTASEAGSPLFQTGYTRDSLSRITELTETVQGTTIILGLTYDSAGRLFEVRRNGTLSAAYEYDANGNRERLTTPNGAVTGTYDGQDRLVTYGTTTFTYTANGELRTKTVPGVGTTTYTYDAFGNLTAVALPDGTQLGYLLDGENRRIGKTVNGSGVQGFLYQGQLRPVAELNGTNQVVSRFVYARRANVPEYLVKGGQTYRLILDHLGSVRLVVNTADGTVAQRLDYDEFGQVTQNTNPGFQPFGYAGGLLDGHTGLVRFGARDYDPATGRWTAKDPILFQGGSPNLYAYVMNDPTNATDANGLQGTSDCSYYTTRCYQSGGVYYCVTAPFFCDLFPKPPDPDPARHDDFEGWSRCTRQCLQDFDADYFDDRKNSFDKKCKEYPFGFNNPDPMTDEFGDWQHTKAHAYCYARCTFEFGGQLF